VGPVVVAVHPAPVRHLPRKAVHPRTSIVRMATPVRVASADMGEFVPVEGGGARTRGMAMRGGLPWIRLRKGYASRTSVPVPREAFLAWLGGDGAGEFGPVLDDLLRGTPLVAAVERTEGAGYRQKRGARGEDAAPGPGETFRDGRPDAPAAVVRYMAEEVALVADGVMVRCRPLAALGRAGGAVRAWLEPFPLSVAGSAPFLGDAPLPVGVDRVRRAWVHWFPDELDPVRESRDVAAYRGALSAHGGPDVAAVDDLHHLAHALPAFLGNQLWPAVNGRGRDADGGRIPATPALAELDRRLWGVRCRAIVGGVGSDEIPAVLALMEEAASDLSLTNGPPPLGGGVAPVLAYLVSGIVPGQAAVPSEDLDALSAFAP
jgi:hypothetical protein